MPNTYAVDFETTYAAGRDISSLGVRPYLRHPDTDLYLVSIVGPGVRYVGPLADAPWAYIDGHHWVSHNAAFDAAVYLEGIRRGLIPAAIAPEAWDCSANLAAYLAAPRSLAKAAHQLLGVQVDKGVRDEMKGQRWETMTEEFRQRCCEYALKDADICLELWDRFNGHWPEKERALSRHTMEMCLRGFHVDLAAVDRGISILEAALWTCSRRIPWADAVDAKGKPVPITSSKRIKEECVKLGIPPPLTTADKSPIFDAWMENHAYQADFIMAVKDYRSINRSLEYLKKVKNHADENGQVSYSLKYGGAHTLRWSGDAGLNFHNLTKDPLCFDDYGDKMPKGTKPKDAAYVVDLRGIIVPPTGKKFIIADLSQIEARVALWLAGDTAQLDLIRQGMDLYEAHARSKMGYKGGRPLKEYCADPTTPLSDRNIRQFAKCRVLGLGFGLGFKKFVDIVKQWAGITITPGEAKKIVDSFRQSNPGITKIWADLDRAVRQHATKGGGAPFQLELPSWRSLVYFDLNSSDGGVRGREEMGGPLLYWYGGKLFENLVQATARDILGEAILRIEAAGYPVVLHVHDEVVVEVDRDVPASVIAGLMTTTPDWAEGLPVGCEAVEADYYLK